MSAPPLGRAVIAPAPSLPPSARATSTAPRGGQRDDFTPPAWAPLRRGPPASPLSPSQRPPSATPGDQQGENPLEDGDADADAEWDEEDTSSWPKEHQKAFQGFKRGRKWGLPWKELVESYIAFEECWAFADGGRMPSKNRPAVFAEFMKAHRNWAKTMPVKDLGTFKEEWWVYWREIQPEDRLDNKGALRRPEKMNWEDFAGYSGKNGLLQIMGTLLWWGEAANKDGPAAAHAWGLAVDEVAWSLQSIVDIGMKAKLKAKRKAEREAASKSVSFFTFSFVV